ncbi:Serine/threonine-protein kinase rio2 [Ophidiomyces ophidiicola]|uniref:Serine/threonine-protein kinase rio2 n=1 Tax=Ophidiomyces ophidiicola TaxID=1387563 RepID=A0ACB8UV76_9EURO|nr:Serine/threonine-protein kinase rio2 [Ophidiomyces ophidiicola]KAI1944997.1 Serine/threonine-protein kinase rio2 [Ophidiomyces ophidiicola]KAI1945110.1 Serine/threonine-protein kinase rio2 [Ophidiomyces ophidiicola]KAI1971139.1 Serine/threonine-protein kinase rio2 [Ophidiomyces ophidiicola]KAI2016945.1 Serine/threonine-protein kinase rio2 [Ophidiomyces ophidiicola]KAI2050164.1 Serine/threonine-protein kinase rio2 [Ophidiomyces ophidiicola]
MKLDAKAMRYLTNEDFRVLAGVEVGSRNHEVVPTPLIIQLSGLRGGSGAHKCISNLAKINLIGRVKNAKYDGYRLTYGGLDYLALHTHQKQKSIYSIGNQIGVGKESDIIVVADHTKVQRILKIHRLGRISFRSIKNNRDYLRHRTSASWMYMSRLAAVKEFAFMKALRQQGFPVPEPIAQNRHTIVMSLIDAFPLRQIASVPDPALLYSELIDLILQLAKFGLIHGDFNEFNILIREESKKADKGKQPAGSEIEPEDLKLVPVIIDFPQMVSTDHTNAEMYFDRDVNCIKRYFQRRFGFVSDEPGPFFRDAKKIVGRDGTPRLDVEVEASGFSRKMARELEAYMKEVGVDGDATGERGDDDSELNSDSGQDEDDNGDGGTLLDTTQADQPEESQPSLSIATEVSAMNELRLSGSS